MKKESMVKSVKERVFLVLLVILSSLAAGCAASKELVKNQPPPPLITQATPVMAAGSLWPGENARNSLFADNKARRVGDIVTILVSESSTGSSKAGTNTSRDTATTAGIASLLGIDKSIQAQNTKLLPTIQMGGSSSNSLKGEGDTSRVTKLTATLTARIMKVLDNGNMLIEGRRQLAINGEDQEIVISGRIRPEDITTDNVIASQYIADASIYYTGQGIINDKMRAGWLTRVMDKVWPF